MLIGQTNMELNSLVFVEYECDNIETHLRNIGIKFCILSNGSKKIKIILLFIYKNYFFLIYFRPESLN